MGACIKSLFTCSVRSMLQNMTIFSSVKFLMGFSFDVCVIGVRVHQNKVQCARACQMIQDGRTQCDVATGLGVSQSCIRNVWRRFQETQAYRGQHGSGQPRATTAVNDRYFTLSVRRNPFQSASNILSNYGPGSIITYT